MIWALFLTAIIFFKGLFYGVKNPLLTPTILYFIILFLGVLFSIDFLFSWSIFFNRVLKFAFIAFFISFFLKSPRDLKLFILVFLLVCGKMGQEGFLGNITGSMLWENQGVLRLHGSTPLYRHPNSFSGMALGTLPFILFIWPIANKYVRILLSVLLLFSINIIIFSGSRTGYIGFILMFIIFFFLSKHKLKISIFALFLFFSINLILPIQYKDRFLSSFTSYHNEQTSAGKRVQILEDAWHIYIQHPFGVGVGAFPIIRAKTYGRTQDTHNLYLEVLTNIGIQGFVIFFYLVFRMIKTLYRVNLNISKQIHLLRSKIAQHKNFENRNLHEYHIQDLLFIRAIVLSTILFIFLRLALGLFGMDLYEIYWWFALGITIVTYNINLHSNIITNQLLQISTK